MALAVKTPESEKQPEKTTSLPKEIVDRLVKEGFTKIDSSNKQILVALSGDPDVSLKTIDLISSYFDKTDVYAKKIGNAFMYIIGRNVFVDVPYDPDFVRELKNNLKKREFIGTSSTTAGTKPPKSVYYSDQSL